MNLVFEENNRSLRSIVKHLELELPKDKDQHKAKEEPKPNELRGNEREGTRNSKPHHNKADEKRMEEVRKAKYNRPCRFEKENRCIFGDRCWYMHRRDRTETTRSQDRSYNEKGKAQLKN